MSLTDTRLECSNGLIRIKPHIRAKWRANDPEYLELIASLDEQYVRFPNREEWGPKLDDTLFRALVKELTIKQVEYKLDQYKRPVRSVAYGVTLKDGAPVAVGWWIHGYLTYPKAKWKDIKYLILPYLGDHIKLDVEIVPYYPHLYGVTAPAIYNDPEKHITQVKQNLASVDKYERESLFVEEDR